jgi:hypothetical protein
MNGNLIIFILFVVILAAIGNYVYSKDNAKKYSNNNMQDIGSKETIDVIEDILGPVCFGRTKPNQVCKDGQELICDKKLRQWRCKLPCESEENPFPHDFFCDPDKIACKNEDYYCNDNYCKNGGTLLYNYSNKNCLCSSNFTGPRCEQSKTNCGNDGEIDPIDNKKCSSCCSDEYLVGNNSVQRYCNFHGSKCINCSESDNLINGVKDPNDQYCKCPSGWGENTPFGQTGKSICRIPPNLCSSDGTVKDSSGGNIVETEGSKIGLCRCKTGYFGAACDKKLCINGVAKLVNNKEICDCSGTGFVGDRCQFNRSYCNNHGDPYQKEKGSPLLCKCDPGFTGTEEDNKCQCDETEIPDTDRCRGLFPKCSLDGQWRPVSLACKDIYKSFGGDEQGSTRWQTDCASTLLTPEELQKGYSVGCLDNPINGKRFIGIATCNSTPTTEQLRECNATPSCYNIYNEANRMDLIRNGSDIIPSGFNKACVCSIQSGAGPKWECKDITNDNRCGPIPPIGFCKKGGRYTDPYCIAPLGNTVGPKAWVCPGAVLPLDIAEALYPVKSNNSGTGEFASTSKWYNTTKGEQSTTIYPTINMSACRELMNDFNTAPVPYDQLRALSELEPAWMSLNSEPGFVDKFGKDDQKIYKMDRIITEQNKFLRFNSRLSKDTKFINKETNEQITLDQFMDKYTQNPDNITDIDGKMLDNKYRITNTKELTNNPSENINVIKPYNIYCAVPLNE